MLPPVHRQQHPTDKESGHSSACEVYPPKPAPRTDVEDEPAPMDYEPPKGKFLLYWGCSETVRAGQPKVLNLETATLAEFGKFMESRRATQLGTHAAAGRPIWPSKTDKRALPTGASLAGQHSFTGQGVPESFKFAIAAAQDLMPEIKLKQTDNGGQVLLEWNALTTARAYFLGSMGSQGDGDEPTMVIWTSSELPDSGFGLFDYQTNAAVECWLDKRSCNARFGKGGSRVCSSSTFSVMGSCNGIASLAVLGRQ